MLNLPTRFPIRTYSIRTMAVLMSLVAVALLPLAWHLRQQRQQQQAIEGLREAGGVIGFRHQWDDARSVPLFDAQAPGQRWLQRWLGPQFMAKADFVSFVDYRGPAQALRPLTRMPHARSVAFVNGNVQPELIETLCAMPQLEVLNLSDTTLTDDGLKRLASLPKLSYISVMGTSVSKEAVLEFQQRRPNCGISSGLDTQFLKSLNRLMSLRNFEP